MCADDFQSYHYPDNAKYVYLYGYIFYYFTRDCVMLICSFNHAMVTLLAYSEHLYDNKPFTYYAMEMCVANMNSW